MNKKKYIGIDIGGTAVKIGSVDEDGTIHATETYAVNFDGYDYIKNVIYGKIIQIKKGERKW